MKKYLKVDDVMKLIHDNAMGRSATFPKGWVCIEDFIELLKKMREE
jgi:hypothetical protein